jgi:uncharacterized protein with GYD domain
MSRGRKLSWAFSVADLVGAGKQQGCVYENFFMTIGSFDMVSVIEAPDDETLAKHVLTVAAGGNLRTITLKALRRAPSDTARPKA